jgi:GDSL-like Lipase/Acylhydrolase family
MRSQSRPNYSIGQHTTFAAGTCLALVIACSSTPETPGGGAGESATGGTQGIAGTGGGKGGSGTGGTTASGGSGGTLSSTGGTLSSTGGTGAGGQAGGAVVGGASGTSFMLGGRSGGAGAGAGGSSGSASLGGSSFGMGGKPGAGGSSAGSVAMGGHTATGGASGAPAAGSGGTAGSGGDFDPCPATGACKILPLGDSITFGIQYEGAYRVEVFHDSLGDSKNITYVGSQMNGPSMVDNKPFPMDHEGHSGYTIDQMQPFVMTTDVPYMPNIILLHIGTNDTYGSSPSGAPMRLATLTDMILTTYPNTLLVVAKIIPYPSQAANVKLINDSIPDLVSSRATQGKHIAMADCNTGFMTSSMLSSDSIHPNQTGYNFMGDQFYSVIKSYLH